MNMSKKNSKHKKKFNGDGLTSFHGLSAKSHAIKKSKKVKKTKLSSSCSNVKATVVEKHTFYENVSNVSRPVLKGLTKGFISADNTGTHVMSETSKSKGPTVSQNTNVKLETKRKKKKNKKVSSEGHNSTKMESGHLNKISSQKINECSKTVDNSTAAINSAHCGNKLCKESIHSKKQKISKWKRKQMRKKMNRLEAKKTHSVEVDITKSGDKAVSLVDASKVSAMDLKKPKSIEDATANWKKLQETLRQSSSVKAGKKRKIPEHALRNPKYRKKEPDVNTEEKKELTEKEPDIWFDDVDEILLDRKPAEPVPVATVAAPINDGNQPLSKEPTPKNPLVKAEAYKGLTKAVGMDCEMVGVGDGTDSMLARVSMVNQYGEPVYDTFVKPKEKVVDYRTHVSGIRPQDLKNAVPFEEVQRDVAEILKGRLLVGHAIMNDLRVLYLSHPKKKIRDTSRFKKFRQLTGGKTPSLKKLAEKVLAVKVQEGEHNSIQDAQAAMRLYTMYRKEWEAEMKGKRRRGKHTKQAK